MLIFSLKFLKGYLILKSDSTLVIQLQKSAYVSEYAPDIVYVYREAGFF